MKNITENESDDWNNFSAYIFYCGETLIERRIKLGLSQKALADRLGVAEQQVQRWESANYERCNFSNVLRVVEALSR